MDDLRFWFVLFFTEDKFLHFLLAILHKFFVVFPVISKLFYVSAQKRTSYMSFFAMFSMCFFFAEILFPFRIRALRTHGTTVIISTCLM